jgi:hypothetical protein
MRVFIVFLPRLVGSLPENVSVGQTCAEKMLAQRMPFGAQSAKSQELTANNYAL